MRAINRQSISTRQLYCIDLILVMLAYAALRLDVEAQAFPTASVGFYATSNKLTGSDFKSSSSAPAEESAPPAGASSDNNAVAGQLAASAPVMDGSEVNFHQFINSKSTPESTIIGELKPNASSLELMLLRNKIAETISRMQEADKQQQQQQQAQAISHEERAECFIEVTRVEKIPGKCHRANNGVPICQSENYMAISNDCN